MVKPSSAACFDVEITLPSIEARLAHAPCAVPLPRLPADVKAFTDAEAACKGVDIAVMVGGFPRKASPGRGASRAQPAPGPAISTVSVGMRQAADAQQRRRLGCCWAAAVTQGAVLAYAWPCRLAWSART